MHWAELIAFIFCVCINGFIRHDGAEYLTTDLVKVGSKTSNSDHLQQRILTGTIISINLNLKYIRKLPCKSKLFLPSVFFSSPELKAQVSYSDRPLSVRPSVRLCGRLSVTFYIFDFFSRTTGPILTRLGTNYPWGTGIQVCSKEGDSPSPRGDNSKRVK
jgi:hypothetical protein